MATLNGLNKIGDANSFNLEGFRHTIQNVARPYLFYVQISKSSNTSLKGLAGEQKYGAQYLTYLVRSTSVPNRAVSNLEVSWQGYKYSFGGVSTWEDWSCTFLLDSDMTGWDNLRNWINVIHDPASNVHGDPKNYTTDGIIIQQLRHDNGNILKSWQLIGAWPQVQNGYALDYSNVDSAQTFDVTFKYVYALQDSDGSKKQIGTTTVSRVAGIEY